MSNALSHSSLSLSASLLLLVISGMVSPLSVAKEASPVVIITPTTTASHETLRLSGTLTAERRALLSPRVDGLVAKINVDAGSHVKKDEVLLQLDPAIAYQQWAQASAATAEAQAARNEASRLVTEAERLRKQNHISESELANRRSNLALQEAALKAALAAENASKEQLNRHALPAPFTGVISSKQTEVGEWVDRGDTVLELVNTDAVRLDVKVPQERFADIHNNTPVTVFPDAFPDTSFHGKINAIVPVSDPQARAFLVRVVIENAAINLLPGTSATAEFSLQNSQQHYLVVPRDALLLHPDGGYSVFIVKDGIAYRKQVKIGQQSATGVSIIDGIQADDTVIIRGNEVLRDQEAVTIVNP